MTTISREEIIKLIKSGFDLELLSFELDIPMEQLQEYSRQLREKEQERQVSKKKASNLRKKEKQDITQKQDFKEGLKENINEEKVRIDYSKTIEKYKKEIAKNPQNSSNKRNLLAFAYFKAGMIDEARDELMSLIDERSSYMAYRQLIHIEKSEGNFEDAKMWAYDFLDKFPTSTGVLNVREQLASIAREEGDFEEVIKQLREIIRISPEDEKSKKILAQITSGEER